MEVSARGMDKQHVDCGTGLVVRCHCQSTNWVLPSHAWCTSNVAGYEWYEVTI